jgi:hypothetical protein
MEVVLIRTEGRGGEARIEVDGRLLTVVDGLSAVGEPESPGVVRAPAFSAIVVPPGSWERAIAANPGHERRLEPRWGWRYLGFAEIVSVDPVRIDLGPLILELDLAVDAPEMVGAFAAIEIDRIKLSRG